MDATLRILILPTRAYGTLTPVTRKPGRLPRALLACALLSLALGQAEGHPGDLDTTFDADGLVLMHFGRIDDDSVGGRNDFANAVAVQPDGKLVVAGSSEASGGSNLVLALARYNPDGTPDTSFGTGGRVLAGPPRVLTGTSFR
ncbi:MAG: delta-60 repeat domain-containing protein [Gammaproteobacteria bacterium]